MPESRSTHSSAPGQQDLHAEEIAARYHFEGPSLELGAVVPPEGRPAVPVRIPLATLTRHGLITGASGSGRTRTLQVMAEQLSALGVPVLASDLKGDLSGLSSSGELDDDVTARARSVGQEWTPMGYPVEYYALGGSGSGVPMRAAISSFGPALVADVLGLNATQASALGTVFGYADQAGLPMLDVADLRAVVHFLSSDAGRGELDRLGPLVSATLDDLLQAVTELADQGVDPFFGEPALVTTDLLQTADDGRGVISLLARPETDRAVLHPAFLLWALADLAHALPEADDARRPSLVCFLGEAELLLREATEDFLDALVTALRGLRARGIAVLMMARSETEVPEPVRAELGARLRHRSDDDAGAEHALGVGEAVVTVVDEQGASTPPAHTTLRAPESLMGPVHPDSVTAVIVGSPMKGKYNEPIAREEARDLLARRLEQGAEKARAEREAAGETSDAHHDRPESPVAHQLMRITAREVARGLLSVARR